MTAFALKLRDTFANFWLEAELFFGKLFKRKAAFEKEGFEEKEKVAALPFSMRMLRMPTKERLFFFDQLATLIGSGVSLIDALSLVAATTKHKGLKKLYAEMTHRINTGLSLADTMAVFPHIFPQMQSALVAAGEKSGNLKTVLAELTEEMEADQDFYRKITGAMFYPVILIGMALVMVIGMLVFVIPKVAAIYSQAHKELPRFTQMVIDLSQYITAHWQALLIGTGGGLLVLWLLFTRVKQGRMIWENIIAIMPVVNKLSREKNLMLIASNMAMLMKSGVLISEAFEITEKAVGNLHYQKSLAEIRHGVIMGREVSEIMGLEDIKAQKFKENKLFPLQVAQLLHIGETTGSIGDMFAKIKKNYHKSIDYTLGNISNMVEPIMIFFVAAIVGSILLAVMLPFFNIGSTIS
ncbi:type II secretion system F family protein [Candidatus Peregrinibacteria bacterium]|nr:type II secretion system F family protein [Candidatus Peregrinibacteria bacterium]